MTKSQQNLTRTLTSFIRIPGIFLCIIIVFSTTLLSQNHNYSEKLSALLDSTQKSYGSSDMLVNGAVYFPEHRQASGSPYLFSDDFIHGTVFTDGLTFDGCELSYNIVTQQLIMLATMPNGARLPIQLDNTLVDSFLLYDYLFVNTNKLNIKINTPFALAIQQGQNQWVLSYTKQFINQYNQNTPHGKFSNTSRSLYYSDNKQLVRIKSRKAFIKLSPEIKKELSQYFSKKRIKIKSASPEQLAHLIEFLHTQTKLQYD